MSGFAVQFAPDAAALAAGWLAALRAERRLAAKSLEAYGRDLSQFAAFLADHLGTPAGMAELRDLLPADFRAFHPGGRLGARLVTVGELMGRGEATPAVLESASIAEAVVEISAKRYGGVAVVDAEGRLVGAFTDGDLRRALPTAGLDARVADHMTRTPVFVSPQTMASEALRVMNERPRPILLLFVCEEGRLAGAVHMHDFLRAGVA